MSDFNDFGNAQVAKLPRHLKQFIVAQNYEKYTPIDQAVWRYVMRQNYSYLKNVAYYPYIKGLNRAGLSIEYIPDLQTMNDNLGKIGWGAVTVDGFIPPAAFMEYQAYRVLVIAADIRQINHIEYTPAPDIIHESAGHAPIIADTDYNNYLSYFGSIGAKAMFSAKDFELYEAIRKLSILKEAADANEYDIAKAEKELRYINENMGEPSEMALLGRLHWWTVEYGLIGTLEDPKIYGAGLLSSIGESASCMNENVEKLWYNKYTVNYTYDITKTQPQLFVTATFQNLIDVLEEFANTMAFRKGGTESIMKAINCKNVATAVYSSGLQVSGVFTDLGVNGNDDLTFIKPQVLLH
jgi:phenylalanine-4-hydroxylase